MDGRGFQKLKTPFIISYKNFQTRESISVVSIKFESPICSIFHFNISPIFSPQNAKHNFNRNYRFTQTPTFSTVRFSNSRQPIAIRSKTVANPLPNRYTRCMHVSGMYKRSPRMDKDLFNDDAAVVWPVFFGSRPNSAPGLDVYSVPRPAFLIDSINSSGAGRGKYRTDIRIDSPLLELARGNRGFDWPIDWRSVSDFL